MASDRLALDPTISTDPQARLLARVADLEQRLQRVETTRVTLPSKPKAQSFASTNEGANYTATYTAGGGFCVIIAGGIVRNPGGTGTTTFSLVVDGTTRATGAISIYDLGAGEVDSTPPMMYSAGVWSGNHTIALNNNVAGPSDIYGWDSAYISVIELPYAG